MPQAGKHPVCDISRDLPALLLRHGVDIENVGVLLVVGARVELDKALFPDEVAEDATMLAACLAISPRIQPPSQERTGIFPPPRFAFPIFSPTGHLPLVGVTSSWNFVGDSLIVGSICLFWFVSVDGSRSSRTQTGCEIILSRGVRTLLRPQLPSSVYESEKGHTPLKHRQAKERTVEKIRTAVREEYGKIAKQGSTGGSCCGPGGGCGAGQADDTSRVLGYTGAELASAPDGANLGLGCGNCPTYPPRYLPTKSLWMISVLPFHYPHRSTSLLHRSPLRSVGRNVVSGFPVASVGPLVRRRASAILFAAKGESCPTDFSLS